MNKKFSFQNFETNSYSVGQTHYSDTKNIVGEITFINKTGNDIKLLVGQFSICNRKKPIYVRNIKLEAEGLGDFLTNLGRIGPSLSKKNAKIVLKNPRPALEIGAKVGAASASRSLKAAYSSLLEVISFYPTGKGLYHDNFV